MDPFDKLPPNPFDKHRRDLEEKIMPKSLRKLEDLYSRWDVTKRMRGLFVPPPPPRGGSGGS